MYWIPFAIQTSVTTESSGSLNPPPLPRSPPPVLAMGDGDDKGEDEDEDEGEGGITAARQTGQLLWLSSHSEMHAAWKRCEHPGSTIRLSPPTNISKHTTHDAPAETRPLRPPRVAPRTRGSQQYAADGEAQVAGLSAVAADSVLLGPGVVSVSVAVHASSDTGSRMRGDSVTQIVWRSSSPSLGPGGARACRSAAAACDGSGSAWDPHRQAQAVQLHQLTMHNTAARKPANRTKLSPWLLSQATHAPIESVTFAHGLGRRART